MQTGERCSAGGSVLFPYSRCGRLDDDARRVVAHPTRDADLPRDLVNTPAQFLDSAAGYGSTRAIRRCPMTTRGDAHPQLAPSTDPRDDVFMAPEPIHGSRANRGRHPLRRWPLTRAHGLRTMAASTGCGRRPQAGAVGRHRQLAPSGHTTLGPKTPSRRYFGNPGTER